MNNGLYRTGTTVITRKKSPFKLGDLKEKNYVTLVESSVLFIEQ